MKHTKTTHEAFERAQQMRIDWLSGEFQTKSALARKYCVSNTYLSKVLNGEKCKDIRPPDGEYKDVVLNGVKFAVYSDGRVWSYTKNFLLSITQKKTGYVRFTVYGPDGSRAVYKVHRLVIENFGPPKPKGCYLVRHLNDIKWDNRIENLAWGTDADNAKDAVRNGKTTYGERAFTAKMNDRIVTRVRLTYRGIGSPTDHCLAIASHYGIELSRRGALFIVTNGWKHLNLPQCIEGVDNTGITKHERKLIMKNFKLFGDKFSTKAKFAKAFAKSLSKSLGRKVHYVAVLHELR